MAVERPDDADASPDYSPEELIELRELAHGMTTTSIVRLTAVRGNADLLRLLNNDDSPVHIAQATLAVLREQGQPQATMERRLDEARREAVERCMDRECDTAEATLETAVDSMAFAREEGVDITDRVARLQAILDRLKAEAEGPSILDEDVTDEADGVRGGARSDLGNALAGDVELAEGTDGLPETETARARRLLARAGRRSRSAPSGGTAERSTQHPAPERGQRRPASLSGRSGRQEDIAGDFTGESGAQAGVTDREQRERRIHDALEEARRLVAEAEHALTAPHLVEDDRFNPDALREVGEARAALDVARNANQFHWQIMKLLRSAVGSKIIVWNEQAEKEIHQLEQRLNGAVLGAFCRRAIASLNQPARQVDRTEYDAAMLRIDRDARKNRVTKETADALEHDLGEALRSAERTAESQRRFFGDE